VVDKKCPAGVCKDLLQYKILSDKCKGCTACARVCPVNAISGTVKQPHSIDPDKCIKCGSCQAKCKFGAIIKE
jgi:NADP-reducing hydrogenase subunit HndC